MRIRNANDLTEVPKSFLNINELQNGRATVSLEVDLLDDCEIVLDEQLHFVRNVLNIVL